MNRRSYLSLAGGRLAALSGRVGSGLGGEGEVATPDTGEDGPPDLDVDGEFLEDQSDSDGGLAGHAFEHVGESTQPWAVVETAPHTREERADPQMSVNFIDEENTVVYHSYDLITDVAGDQLAEFMIEYAGDDPERVSEYKIVVDVR